MEPSATSFSLNRRSVPFVFFCLALAILIFYVLIAAQTILVPLVVAAFLSFLIVSLQGAISSAPVVGRYLPDIVSFILSFAFIVLVILIITLIVRENVEAVLTKAPQYQRRLMELAESLVLWADRVPFIPPDAMSAMVEIIEGVSRGIIPESVSQGTSGVGIQEDSIRRTVLGFVRSVVQTATSAAGSLLGSAVTIFLYTAFILLERGRFAMKLTRLAGSSTAQMKIEAVVGEITHLVRTYISTKTLMNLSVASISYILMGFLGTDFAGFWALLIFIFGYIPIVGAIIAVSLPTLLTLLAPDGGLGRALLTMALLTSTEQTISSFVEPRVMGRTLNLSPLVILISLASWGAIWGFAGMILSVPLTVTLLIVLSQFEVTRPLAVLLSDRGNIAPIAKAAPPPTDLAEPAS